MVFPGWLSCSFFSLLLLLPRTRPSSIMGDRGPTMAYEEALDVLQGMFAGWSRPALGQMLQVRERARAPCMSECCDDDDE